METATLHNLVTSLECDQAYLEIAAASEASDARMAWAEQRAGTIGMIVAQIRGEIMSRDTPDARSPGAMQQFETYLEHVLKDYLDTG